MCSYDGCVSPALLVEVGHCAKGHLVPLRREHVPLQLRGKHMQQQESFLLSESVILRFPACQSYLKAASDLEPGTLSTQMLQSRHTGLHTTSRLNTNTESQAISCTLKTRMQSAQEIF